MKMIVACTNTGGIGFNNALPWHIPADLGHFKETTDGEAVVMGRKTFESIGRILPNRLCIVITRDPKRFYASLPEGLQYNANLRAMTIPNLIKYNTTKTLYLIGGADIYKALFSRCDEIIMSRVPGEWECDKFFPVELLDRDVFNSTTIKTLPSDIGDVKVVSYTRK